MAFLRLDSGTVMALVSWDSEITNLDLLLNLQLVEVLILFAHPVAFHLGHVKQIIQYFKVLSLYAALIVFQTVF